MAENDAPALSVRFCGIPELADGDWVHLTQGITVLTGRNNVGKTRILQTIASLRPEADAVALPRVSIETPKLLISIETGPNGLLESYGVTDSDGTTAASWRPDPNNPDYSSLSFGDRGIVTIPTHQRGRWNQFEMPHTDLVTATLNRLTFVPAQRTIPGIVPVRRVEVPAPDGHDLGEAIVTHRNDVAPKFDELESVIRDMFPEIGAILAPVIADNQVQICYRDQFAARDTPLQQSGTGVAQALHLVSLVLFSPPGRIFLIDEPHAFLYPGAERRLVQFLRAHSEHSYVCATHSPVFLSAAQPETCWLVGRDASGTTMRSVFTEGYNRRHIFAELGIEPGEVALAEQVLFVEGPADHAAYPILLRRLGFDVNQRNCAVISLNGADLTRPLSDVMSELGGLLELAYNVLLDGDKRDDYKDNPRAMFLPFDDLEEFLLQDPDAVRAGLLAVMGDEAPEAASATESEWSAERVAKFLVDNRRPATKAVDLLVGLARHMGTSYRKPVQAPRIAEAMRQEHVEQLRPVLAERLGFAAQSLADASSNEAALGRS